LTIWTGSVIGHDGLWYLFYTGANHAEQGLVQRTGLAISDDLVTWSKHPANPMMEADERWYERLPSDDWYEEAWRDPFVFRGQDGCFHALITARQNEGRRDERGVIGHAQSSNLVEWDVLSPLASPREFADMEVPQLQHIDGRYYLFFSVAGVSHSERRIARLGGATTGTYYLVSDEELGPFELPAAHTLHANPAGTHFAGRVFATDGGWAFMAFRYLNEIGEFVGTLTDPLTVTVADGGMLRLEPEGSSA
jgi:beta-fructofuranosidase